MRHVVMVGWELPYVFEYGGLGVYGRCLVDALVRRGFSVTWYGCVPDGYGPLEPARRGDYTAVPVAYVSDLSDRDVSGIRSAVVTAVYHAVRYGRVDALITHDHHVAPAAEVGLRYGVPTIHAVHTVSGDVVEGGVMMRVGKVVTNSALMRDTLISVLSTMVPAVEPRPSLPDVRVIHPAVPPFTSPPRDEDVAAFRRALRYADVVVGVLGRYQWNKNYGVVVEAVRKIREEGVNAGVLMSGVGLDQYATEEWVIHVGRVPEEKKASFYRALDVFVLPSTFEPFGMVALEAASLGVPVIISANAGVGEVLKSAPRFEPSDPESLAKTILDVIGHKDVGLGGKLREEATSRTWDDVVEEYVEVLGLE